MAALRLTEAEGREQGQGACTGPTAFVHRHYRPIFVAVLALAAFNVLFRLGSDFVNEWDSSLYAISAAEALTDGHWIGTTFLGELDYYNTKPPLNVWLIALAFKVFGTNLVALRLTSAISAWLTVAVLVTWTRRCLGPVVALLSGVVLSTSFGFIHVHSGRSANTDALFTLLMVLSVVALRASESRDWHLVWLGPLAAASFLLRGMGVLMPLALIAGVFILRGRKRLTCCLPATIAVVLFLVPVGVWLVARYRVDGWAFIKLLWWYDFVARSTSAIEGHAGGPLYYANILQRHQFDWLLAGLTVVLLYPPRPSWLRDLWLQWRSDRMTTLFATWSTVTLVVPTLMQTKVPWYLNTFYPLFAIGMALTLAYGARRAMLTPHAARGRAFFAALVLIMGVAESRLVWYSVQHRDLSLSDQGLMLAQAEQLAPSRLFRDRRDFGGTFVARYIVGTDPLYAVDVGSFLRQSRLGDYFLTAQDLQHPDLELVQANVRYRLYRR